MTLPAPLNLHLFSVSANAEPNRYLGVRFDNDGVFLPEPGNTVVRHVVPGSQSQSALIDLRARLRALPWGHRFAFTDIPSLHMTVFEGALGSRRQAGFWPGDLPLDAPLDQVTAHLARKLDGFEGPGPFAMRIVEVTPFGLKLTGATERDEKTARAWRDALAETFGYRSPTHDSYVFHVTLAYIIDWLPDGMIPAYEAALAALTEEMKQRIPVVELEAPAFCTFADMNAFPQVSALRGCETAATAA